jgi:hypothetical protein
MLYLEVILFAVYFVVGVGLEIRARKYLKDRDRLYTFPPILTPDYYTPEGQPARRFAARYWAVAGAVLFLVLHFLF